MRVWKTWPGHLLCSVVLLACTDAHRTHGEGVGVARQSEAFSFPRVDKVDMVFVVDNSNSMAGEQAALRAQFPRLMEILTTGARGPDDTRPFTPVRDLHVGVVSTDMGIPGVELPPSCHADGGDDGSLTTRAHVAPGLTCDDTYPHFLSYQAGTTDPEQLAHDFQCLATLGTGGCGFEQPLEAGFKALWPKLYIDASGEPVTPNPYRFLSINEEGSWGRGDVPSELGGNLGLLRNDPKDPSLLVIVVVTDEEDCSVKSTEHLRPNNQLPEDSLYRRQDINLRCFWHPEFRYDLQARYLEGFRALRPGREDLVVFSAIVGVPPELVAPEVLGATDFDDAASREAFYDTILDDPRMQEQVDPQSMPGSGKGNLKPSCVRNVPDESEPATAYPPRRIVKLAEMFGPNGMVQSICQDDFGPAVDMLVNTMSKPLGEMCLPQRLIRDDAGSVDCKLYWELPTEERAQPGTPTSCTELGSVAEEGAPEMTTADGGARCEVHQVPVQDGAVALDSEGWYYDDFPRGSKRCAVWGYRGASRLRITRKLRAASP